MCTCLAGFGPFPQMDDILHKLVECGVPKRWKLESWSFLPISTLKFNVDEAAKGKPGPASIDGVLHNDGKSCPHSLSMWGPKIPMKQR